MAGRRLQFSKRTTRISLVILLFVLWFFLRGLLGRALQVIEIPFVQAGTWITQRVGLFQDAQQVSQEEVAAYEQQALDLAVIRAHEQELEKENAQLKKTLGFVEGRNVTSLGASVLSRTTTNEQSRLVVNRGTDDGVFVGAPAIVEDGLYVGKVMSVTKTQSIVSTLTDNDHATAVSLLNETQTIGLAHGLNGNLTRIDFIPLDEYVEIDHLAVTSGLEQYVPSGLLVGFVNTVRPDPSGPFQQAIVEPIVDIRRYTHVILLLPKTL